MERVLTFILLAGLTPSAIAAPKTKELAALTASAPIYGVLQDTPEHWNEERAAGVKVIVLETSWARCEPHPDTLDGAYLTELKTKLAKARAAGFQIILSPGWQYPPAWIFQLPNSRYVNQFGDTFDDPAPGMAGFNAVFNDEVRERLEKFLDRLLGELGTDFLALRLGGGWYNELNYPPHHYHGHVNCYWAFDDLGQGRVASLPAGIRPCPVAGWLPGTPAAGRDDSRAGRFIDWYLDSLKNYHDWQVTMARKLFPRPLLMLYPSWGIRPGQIDAAVADQLGGKTSAEINGEVPRGLDFARCIRGISDPGVIVYCTWEDAHTGNDTDTDPAHWEPVHYLSLLAGENPLRLKVWGENTGRNDAAAMHFGFEQMRRYHLLGLVWAFESDLYDGRHATISQLSKEIAAATVTPISH